VGPWGRPILRENLAETDQHLQKRRFPIDILTRSWRLSRNIPSEKSSINTNGKSTTNFPLSLMNSMRCLSAPLPLSSQGGSKTISVTLNDLERLELSNRPYFALFHRIRQLWRVEADYVSG